MTDMSKIPTSWKRPGQVVSTVDYDAPNVDYDDPTKKYVDGNSTRDTSIKTPGAWSRTLKTATKFVKNIAAQVNDALFDTARIYDVNATYDGIVATEPHSTAKKPQPWSRQ